MPQRVNYLIQLTENVKTKLICHIFKLGHQLCLKYFLIRLMNLCIDKNILKMYITSTSRHTSAEYYGRSKK